MSYDAGISMGTSAAPPPPPQQGASMPMGQGRQLPPGVAPASPWMRLGSYFLEAVLAMVTLGIGWLIWASMTAGSGQTPAKKLMGMRVIAADSLRPVGMGRMFWVRGLLAGCIASFAIPLTVGILLFMPFWDRRNQNLWDKVSGTYVVTDPGDAWGLT